MVGGVGWVSTAPWQTWMGIPIGRTPGGVNPFGERRERDNRPEQTRKKESLQARLNGTKEGIKGEKGRQTYSFHPHTHPSSSIPVGKALSKRKQAGTPWRMWREGFPGRGPVEVGLCTPKGLESERARERVATWQGPSWSFLRAEGKESPPSSGPQTMQPQGLLSQREGSLRGAVRADVHTRAPEPLLAPGAAPRRRLEQVRAARLQMGRPRLGADGVLSGAHPRQAPRGCAAVSWAPGTLSCKTPPVRRRAEVCLPDLAVDGQPGGVAVGFEGLKHVLGVGVPGGPLEAGAQTRTASGLDREKLALVKPLPIRGCVGK